MHLQGSFGALRRHGVCWVAPALMNITWDVEIESQGLTKDNVLRGHRVWHAFDRVAQAGHEDREIVGVDVGDGPDNEPVFGVLLALLQITEDLVLILEKRIVQESSNPPGDFSRNTSTRAQNLALVREQLDARREHTVASGAVGNAVGEVPVLLVIQGIRIEPQWTRLECKRPTVASNAPRGECGALTGEQQRPGKSGACHRERQDQMPQGVSKSHPAGSFIGELNSSCAECKRFLPLPSTAFGRTGHDIDQQPSRHARRWVLRMDLLDSSPMDGPRNASDSTPSSSAGPPQARQITISKPGSSRLLEAVERLLRSDRRHAERFMRFARDARMSLDHVWCAIDSEGVIQATVLASPSPGRTAMLFASSPHSAEDAALVGRVIDDTCQSLHETDVGLAQALVEPSDRLEQEAFIHGGLRRLAILAYMERPVPRRNSIAQPKFPANIRIERYRSEHRPELEQLLVQTYERTLDCPGLAGLRRPDDVVEGHMHSGIFKPEWWVLARDRTTDQLVGVSLMNGSAGSGSIELVYLGVVPQVRGQGIGRALLQHGLRLVAGARERNVVLAVDESNDPALDIYEELGFHRTIRRVALVRRLDKEPISE